MRLGDQHFSGDGVAVDKAKALEYWRAAADRGSAAAQCNVGLCLFKGDGAAMSVCEAKTRCRRMGKRCAGIVRVQDRTTFLARDELFNAVQRSGTSATLFVALYGRNGDALRNALRSYDASGKLQMRAAAYAVDGGAPVFRNTTTHDNTIYEVAQARSEFWLDIPNQKLSTVDGGLCEAKAACARHKRCRSFV